MIKLYLKNFIVGMLCAGISSIIATALFALICLGELSFNAISIYILGGIIGLVCSIILQKFLILKYNYFHNNKIADSSVQKPIWIQHIREKIYVKRWNAYLTYLPTFISSVAIIIIGILTYTKLFNLLTNNKWYSMTCALIGASAISLLIYSILGIKSFEVCKRCGAVNAFIYDETIDCETMSITETKSDTPTGNLRSFVKQNIRSYSGKSNDSIVKSGFAGDNPSYSERKVERFNNKVARHCACCGEKTLISEKDISYGKWNIS